MPRRRWVLILAVLLAATAAGCLRDFDDRQQRSRLSIADVDVAAPAVTTGTVTLDVSPTLVNGGDATGEVNLTIKAYDAQTGLLQDTARTTLGSIPEETTVSPTLTVEVPREHGARIRVEVHESDQLRQTGRVTVSNLAGLDPTDHDTPLGIGEMDFLVRDVTRSGDGDGNASQEVRIETRVYLTNEGDQASDPVRIQVRAREADTSLLGDEAWTQVPTVRPGATHLASVNLTVPDEHNYVVQVALWEDDFVLERGRGTVQLLPKEVQQEGEEIVVSDPDVEDFVQRGPGADRGDGGDRGPNGGGQGAVPGPGTVAAAAAVLAAALLGRSRRGGDP